MSRKGGRKRPPRLDEVVARPAAPSSSSEPRPVTERRRLVEAGVAGPPGRRSREEVSNAVRRLSGGDPVAALSLDLGPVTRPEADAAVADAWGCQPGQPRMVIDPDRLLAGAKGLGHRLREVATGGGRIALATGRPASLLPLLARLGSAARAEGATVVEFARYGPLAPERHPERWLWWHDGVAVVTDGERLLSDETPEVGDDWVFAVGRPDLVVADHAFAGAAVAAGLETWALADLDAPALGVAAGRGLLGLVPLDDRCPPAAYAPLGDAILAMPSGGQEPHSTTGVAGPYAPADSGVGE